MPINSASLVMLVVIQLAKLLPIYSKASTMEEPFELLKQGSSPNGNDSYRSFTISFA